MPNRTTPDWNAARRALTSPTTKLSIEIAGRPIMSARPALAHAWASDAPAAIKILEELCEIAQEIEERAIRLAIEALS